MIKIKKKEERNIDKGNTSDVCERWWKKEYEKINEKQRLQRDGV